MAINRFEAAALLLIAVTSSTAIMAFAKEYVVGDDAGWRKGFDYESWAEGKTFYVGDVLVFLYPEGYHTVVKVNGTGFKQCQTSPNAGILTTGSDRVTLATSGNKWYICGVADHCSYYGQKLKITVLPKDSYGDMPVPMAAPAPAPWFTLTPLLPVPMAAPAPAPMEMSPEMSAPMEPPAESPWY